MKTLPLTTRTQANALRAKLRTSLGLPRAATLADRIGGGIHVPLDLCVTTEAVEVIDLEDGTHEAHVPPELEARLSAGERTRLRAPTARAVPALEAVRDEKPVAVWADQSGNGNDLAQPDEPSAPSQR